MRSLSILILVDRLGHGIDLSEAVQTFASCQISIAKDLWADWSQIDGVIVNLSIEKTLNRLAIEDMKKKIVGREVPIILMLPSCDDISIKYAKKLGATTCMSTMADTSMVVSTLFRQVAPYRTLTDLLVERSLIRTGALFKSMFEAGRSGKIDAVAIENAGDPVVSALRDGGLERWLDLVQAHDDMTVRHCLLVAGLVANFAIHLGLSATDRATLVRAGLVHDVGKAQIPLAILNKPGPLNADEMAVMRTHARRGYDILLASGMCDPIVLAVTCHHHEMLDGSGYPDGLCGDQIGDAVRLLTVCDIYAALTERRPYRAAMPQTEALQILRSMAPNRLEMAIVEAFANSLGQEKSAMPIPSFNSSQAIDAIRHDVVRSV